ncbi:MAG: hypothetical protein U9Q85_03305 [Patescibacteria group bacterium]|nr:hypothetical protein [Patescibacteria group bacterium]
MSEDENNKIIKEKIINQSEKSLDQAGGFGVEKEKVSDFEKHEIPIKIDKGGEQKIDRVQKTNGIKSSQGGENDQRNEFIPDKKRRKKIEKIMSHDLKDRYLELSAEKQKEFKQKGEKAASKISNLIAEDKANLKKIVYLIKNWLRILPGIDSYFLEQEVKIKADEIIKLKDISNKNL